MSKINKRLLKLLEKPPQVLLFEGPKGVGKGECSISFALELLKTTKKDPPDLRQLFPEGKAHHHPMHAIKRFIEEASLPPFEAEKKVFIIHEAERMLPSSSNALLKTLEEPLPAVVIILVTSHSDRLLPTITSRCFSVPFDIAGDLASKKKDILSEKMFHVGFRLLRGDLPTSKELPDIDDPEEAFSYLLYFYRDLHLLHFGGDLSLLFYQDKEEVLSRIAAPLPPLEILQERIEKALQATRLHLPFAHTLATLINS